MTDAEFNAEVKIKLYEEFPESAHCVFMFGCASLTVVALLLGNTLYIYCKLPICNSIQSLLWFDQIQFQNIYLRICVCCDDSKIIINKPFSKRNSLQFPNSVYERRFGKVDRIIAQV